MRSTQESGQILRSKKRPRRTLRSGRGSRTNSNTSRQIPARVIDAAYDTLPAAGFCADLRKRSVFGCPPRTLAKFGLGIDRRPTHNSPMNKLYYERADYSVVVKGTSSKGMEVGDLPGRKCQPHQAVIGLFRHYRGGQAGGQSGPRGLVE